MAEAVGDNEEVEFERYTPNHPLPEEIRQMKRDDTVCRYCGVSYLIHNEIKGNSYLTEENISLSQNNL